MITYERHTNNLQQANSHFATGNLCNTCEADLLLKHNRIAITGYVFSSKCFKKCTVYMWNIHSKAHNVVIQTFLTTHSSVSCFDEFSNQYPTTRTYMRVNEGWQMGHVRHVMKLKC